MQSTPFLLVDRYPLSQQEIIAELESTLSTALSERSLLEVTAHLRENFQLETIAHDLRHGGIKQHLVHIAKYFKHSKIEAILEQRLATSSTIKQVRRLKTLEKEMVWGQISHKTPDGHIYIETEIFPDEPLIAVCPLNRVGIHERHTPHLQMGQRRAFHLRRVDPVRLNGQPRIKMVVDRVSKTLTENLLLFHLRDQTDQLKIRCVKRFVGHKSVVLANKRLPKKVIVAVDKELRERVEVHIQINLR
jgi:hypothetical protein